MSIMLPDVTIDQKIYKRIPIHTHLIQFGEDLPALIKKYGEGIIEPGDWVAISEKVVSVCQNNVRHISTVKAGWLAKLIVKGVKKYPNDIGFSKPEKMQLAVEISGTPRMLLAVVVGGILRLVGIHGVFWRIAGNRVSEIDGFNPDSMYPYTEYAALPPLEPEKLCADIESALGIPAVIIDGNNINVEIIAASDGVPVDKKTARLILLDNPMGQDDEMTPFILVREIKNK
jgi:hypothetical protein